MTEEQLKEVAPKLHKGEELIILTSTGAELRGPYLGFLDDGLMVDASPGMAVVPAAEIADIITLHETDAPE